MEALGGNRTGADTARSSGPAPTGSVAMVRFTEPELQVFKAEVRQPPAAVRPRARAEEQTTQQLIVRAMTALGVISAAIRQHPGTGQTRRLVRFIAGCYNGSDYPFDLTDLRALDTPLARACLDYLDYDRLSIEEVHHHLPGGEQTLHEWLRDYDVRVAST
jgi:hypothetical protein